MYIVYILYSSKLFQFYKGQTNNLEARISRHNNGYETHTKKGIPWTLIWSTRKDNRGEAISIETKLKNLGRKPKIQFMLNYSEGIAGPDELLLVKQLSGC